MAIEYVGGQTASVLASTATNTTINFALTGGIASTPAAGDFVVVSFATGSTADRAIGVITSGYAETAELYSSDTFDPNLSVNWKFMGSTPDTSVVIGPTGATTDAGFAIIQVWRGVDATTPLDVARTTASGGNSGIPNPAAITPASANTDIVVIGATASSGGNTFTASYLSNFLTGSNTASTNDITIGAGWVNGPAAGVAYDPAAFTVTGSANTQSWAAVTLALREAIPPQTYGKWDFESGTTADFSVAYAGTSVVTGQGQVGTYCGASTIGDGATAGFGFRPSGAFRTTEIYSKFRFKVDLTANPSAESQIILPTFRDSAQAGIVDLRVVVSSGGVMTLLVANIVTVSTLYFGTSISDNTWYDIEFSAIRNGAGASSVSLSVNGTNVYSTTTTDLGAAEIWYPEFSSLMAVTNGTAGTVYYDEIVLSTSPIVTHALTAASVTTGTPAVGSPAVGQRHAMIATGVTTGAPAIAPATLAQIHALTATGITTGTTTTGSSAIGQTHTLTATGITTGAPSTGAPVLSQNSSAVALTAAGITTGSPTTGTPLIGQAHTLAATGLATSAPTNGAPSLGQHHALTANGITTGSPTLGAPALTQAFALTAAGILTAAPTVGSPAIGQVHAVTATAITAGSHTLGTPAIGQWHSITATAIATGSPTVGSSALGQRHGLTATGIATAASTLAAPAVGQAHALTATALATGAPVLGSPLVGVPGAMVALPIVTGAPTLGAPALGQTHAIAASGIVTAAPVMPSPALAQAHALMALPVVTGAPSTEQPILLQRHALAALGIVIDAPVLGTPELAGPFAFLTALNITTSAPILANPILIEGPPPAADLLLDSSMSDTADLPSAIADAAQLGAGASDLVSLSAPVTGQHQIPSPMLGSVVLQSRILGA